MLCTMPVVIPVATFPFTSASDVIVSSISKKTSSPLTIAGTIFDNVNSVISVAPAK